MATGYQPGVLAGRDIIRTEGKGDDRYSPEEYFNVRNPLKNYRSHGFRWFITAHNSIEDAVKPPTVEDRTKYIGEDYSGGGIVVVNEFTDVRLSVNEIDWESYASGVNDVTISVMGGTLSLTEPHGVSLLAMLRDWTERLGTTWVIQTVFAARVSFTGHRDDNTSDVLAGYEGGDRPLLFTLGDFNASFTLDGVAYNAQIVPCINGSLNEGNYSPIASLVTDKVNRSDLEQRQKEAKTNQSSDIMTGQFAKHIISGTPLPAHWQQMLQQRKYNTMSWKTGQPSQEGTEDDIRSKYNSIKNGSLKAGDRVQIEFRNPQTDAPISYSVTVPDKSARTLSQQDAFAYLVGKQFTQHFNSMVQNTENPPAEDGLVDADEERKQADEIRCQTLESVSTVGEAFVEFERALNAAALEMFEIKQQQQETDGRLPSPLKFQYSLVAEGELGVAKLDNIAPKTQQTMGCLDSGSENPPAENHNAYPVNISFDPQWSIPMMIQHILSHSAHVADEVNLNQEENGTAKRKETSKVVRIRTMRMDQGPDKPIKIQFLVSLADSAVPRDPDNLSTAAAGAVELEFDYLYGNRYTDLVEFDMSLDFGNLMYAKLLGTGLGTNVPSSGDAKRNVSSVVASPDATNKAEYTSQVSTGSPFAEKTAYPERTQAFLTSISDAAMLQHSEIAIRTIGDPYLCWDSMCDPQQYITPGTTPKGHYFTDPHRDPVRVKLNIKYPVYHSPRDASADPSASAFLIQPFWYQKPYHLYMIKNTFNKEGGFTQTLSLMFDPNIDRLTP